MQWSVVILYFSAQQLGNVTAIGTLEETELDENQQLELSAVGIRPLFPPGSGQNSPNFPNLDEAASHSLEIATSNLADGVNSNQQQHVGSAPKQPSAASIMSKARHSSGANANQQQLQFSESMGANSNHAKPAPVQRGCSTPATPAKLTR